MDFWCLGNVRWFKILGENAACVDRNYSVFVVVVAVCFFLLELIPILCRSNSPIPNLVDH